MTPRKYRRRAKNKEGKNDLKTIHKNNHIIGLHSHSQFHRIGKLNTRIQMQEYKKNVYLLNLYVVSLYKFYFIFSVGTVS